MASNFALVLLFWKWRPLKGTVWAVQNTVGSWLLDAGYAFGWALLLLTTFVINHFDLFGLRQIWLKLQGRPQAAVNALIAGRDKLPVMLVARHISRPTGE